MSAEKFSITTIINLPLSNRQKIAIKPCPFCGSKKIECCNTHTPSYWIECEDCGAQVHGQAVWDKPSDYSSVESHSKARALAVRAWNRRSK